ncbi:Membrane protein involved in the export of O-antigen and teichoic acid [Aquiflexum balticum DSM 16537]|uniref:Membrane protein involved in the export of O-antigen and teichoic acid n=1 Tax=Aquiflexum balticum DSM 16537 TaxID=758820 RepID=A0A1W2H4B3_9BACT|nr:polysaccharide biosynthesis C-terminal domain-containing protein [Aquiflexum balticum]SMD43787.1 Membrane protein involved in the export of O-antigen and teichoic acid [Aquiflexum balticum DSM 16537]
MSQLKKLAGQTAIYGISSILGRTVNFLLIPIYTAYLTKDAVGAYTALYGYMALFNIIFTYGMETTYFRFATGKGLDPEKVFAQVQSLLITTSLSLGAIIYISAPTLASWLNYEGQENIFRWIAWILAIDAILVIPYAKLRKENKAFQFAFTKVSNILINVGLNIFFIVFCFHILKGDWLSGLSPIVAKIYNPNWGVEYIFISNLIANAAMLPVLFWLTKKFRFAISRAFIKPMWHYAFPLLFMGLAGTINETFSRTIFEYILPEGFYEGLTSREATGVFGANFKLAILMNLIIQAFKYAAEPFFFNQAADKNSPELFAKVMHVFVIFCSGLMIAVSVNLDLLGAIFLRGEGYAMGNYIVPVLLLGYLMLGIYFNLSIWFKLTDKTKYSFYITGLGAIVTILVLITLVPKFGLMGGALSTLSCYTVMSVVCYFIGQKHFPIPYQLGKGIFYLLFSFGLSYLGFFWNWGIPIIQFIGRNSLVFVFVLVVLWIEKNEVRPLLSRFQKNKI